MVSAAERVRWRVQGGQRNDGGKSDNDTKAD